MPTASRNPDPAKREKDLSRDDLEGMAEREGFEPPIPVKVCPLSRRIVSTTHAPLRFFWCAPRTNRSRATNLLAFVCACCSAPRRVVGLGACREACSGLTWSIGPKLELSQALHLPSDCALRAQTAQEP